MDNKNDNPYVLFDAKILQDWKANGVNYVKVVELDSDLAVKFFELIPDSEIPDAGETIYHVNSEDVTELLEPLKHAKFLVHEIYLEED